MKRKHHIENKNKKIISLTLVLVVLVLTTSQISSFELLKSAVAAGLSNISAIPSTNTVSEKSTYDLFFTTATTGTIKNITMLFPSGFQIFEATKVIERSGIGSGFLTTLPGPNSRLVYVVNNPVSIPAGTEIRLEIGTIVNRVTAGTIQAGVGIVTFGNTIIDVGRSSPLTIKDITSTDVSPNFMIRKTLDSTPAGHAMGWNPDSSKKVFLIKDRDINGDFHSVMVTFYLDMAGNNRGCSLDHIVPGLNEFQINCNFPPTGGSQLHYMITKLPPHYIGNSSSTSSLPSDSLDDNESSTRGNQSSSSIP